MNARERASQIIQAAFKHWTKDLKLAIMDDELLHKLIVAGIEEAAKADRDIRTTDDPMDDPKVLSEIARRGYLRGRIAELKKALRTIADNTCCDKCQEAALVAKEALEGGNKTLS